MMCQIPRTGILHNQVITLTRILWHHRRSKYSVSFRSVGGQQVNTSVYWMATPSFGFDGPFISTFGSSIEIEMGSSSSSDDRSSSSSLSSSGSEDFSKTSSVENSSVSTVAILTVSLDSVSNSFRFVRFFHSSRPNGPMETDWL